MFAKVVFRHVQAFSIALHNNIPDVPKVLHVFSNFSLHVWHLIWELVWSPHDHPWSFAIRLSFFLHRKIQCFFVVWNTLCDFFIDQSVATVVGGFSQMDLLFLFHVQLEEFLRFLSNDLSINVVIHSIEEANIYSSIN